MAEQTKMDPMDELLRIFYLESKNITGTGKTEETFFHLKALPDGLKMSEHKRQQLFEKLLSTTIGTQSFGQLLLSRIQEEGLTAENLASLINLSSERINALIKDEFITSHIPVMLLKNLLNTLQISLDEAQRAIWRTFEILQQRENKERGGESLQVSFRRSYTTMQRGSGIHGVSDSKSLYRNKEALDRYLNLLEELMRKRKNND